jgi:transcription elongation factor GreB
MSRAFVKEDDFEAVVDLPERPRSPYPNYITPRGLHTLQARCQMLAEQQRELPASDDLASQHRRRQLEREWLTLSTSVQSAIVIDPAAQPHTDIRFGASVELLDEQDKVHRFILVGEEEVCVPQGQISWVSPLGKSLIGKQVGDIVSWERPLGNVELEILSFHYPTSGNS